MPIASRSVSLLLPLLGAALLMSGCGQSATEKAQAKALDQAITQAEIPGDRICRRSDAVSVRRLDADTKYAMHFVTCSNGKAILVLPRSSKPYWKRGPIREIKQCKQGRIRVIEGGIKLGPVTYVAVSCPAVRRTLVYKVDTAKTTLQLWSLKDMQADQTAYIQAMEDDE
jgi:hypothetical protein